MLAGSFHEGVEQNNGVALSSPIGCAAYSVLTG